MLAKIEAKIKTLEEACTWCETQKGAGKKVVFTNGCFDILHLGHVTYLAKAAALGDSLIVALNSDNSVRRQQKGENRPINPENARLMVLASLECVDAVLLFDNDTPLAEIESLLPSVLVKGADYDPNETNPLSKRYIVGRDYILKSGGEVKSIQLVDGYSTTSILNKSK